MTNRTQRRAVRLGMVGLVAAAVAVMGASVTATPVTATPVMTTAPMAATAEVSLTGCLAAGDEEGEFTLGRLVEPPESVEGEEVELIPAEDVDLQSHVGHRVEVTGDWMEDPQEESGQEEAGDEQHLKVTGLQHISTDCGPDLER